MKEEILKKSENNNIKKINNTVEPEKHDEKKVKREMEQRAMYKATRRKRIILVVSVITALIIISFISTIFAVLNINNEKIIKGVSISGIDVSGLTKEEAKEKLDEIYSVKKEKEIEAKYQEYENTLNPTLMEVNYDTEKAVNNAYLVGRKQNIFLSNYGILFTLIKKKNIDVEMTLNEEETKKIIEDIGANLPGILVESNYSIEGNELIITKGKAGVVVDTDSFLKKIKTKLNDINEKDDYIEISVINKEPDIIDIDKIHEEVYTEAKDAYYTKEPFSVYPEVEGVDFDVEEAKKILQEDKDEYVIKLKITKPKVTLDQIGKEAFPNKLSTFTTRYDPSDVDRTTNLRIACQKINGKVVLAGDTFSYNQTLGARTAAAGYKNAKVYEAGEVVDGIGGGICQISSTLYNAILMANLQAVERRNHQFTTSYVGAGRDATVVYGVTDFKFKNTRKYPVRIVASAQNGIATVSIYGIKEEEEYTFNFYTKVISTIAPTIKYEEDSSLPSGTENIKRAGTNGQITETYITKILNGKTVSTNLLSRDTYSAMQRIVVRGTGAIPVTETQPQSTTNTQQNVQSQMQSTETPTNPSNDGINNVIEGTETVNP